MLPRSNHRLIYLGCHSVGDNRVLVTPSCFQILNDPTKTEIIVQEWRSRRSTRCYSKREVFLKTGVCIKEVKNLMVAMCTLWLEAEGVTYGMETEEEERVERMRDASERYDKTNAMVILFVRTHFPCDNTRSFRLWGDRDVEERERLTSVMEYVVLQTLTAKGCLPLELVKDNWATNHLLSIAIRNQGQRNKAAGKKQNVRYFIILIFYSLFFLST